MRILWQWWGGERKCGSKDMTTLSIKIIYSETKITEIIHSGLMSMKICSMLNKLDQMSTLLS